jgi:hypothetical protein
VWFIFILKELPMNWSRAPIGTEIHKTRSKLIQDRKKELMPHISYDLDGDGIVGGRDLVVASRFDVDKDGRLSSIERENAIRALRDENYEDNFAWGIEQSGANVGNRVIQKRGMIITGEDFTVLKDTYPQHPLSSVPISYINRSELL